MGWVTEKFSDGFPVDTSTTAPQEEEQTFESTAEKIWNQLTTGFERDVSEINHRNGDADADVKQLEAHQSRISSSVTKIAVVVTVDFSAHTIQYVYEPEDAPSAVPEQGILTMRPSASGIELYSADQRLSSDEARRLILEPLFFVNPPLEATGS
jgi:stress response protein SCP2